MADLLSKAKESIRKGVTTASVKSKELMDTQRVKSQIKKLEEEKKTALEELGAMAYDMSSRGEFDQEAIRRKCEAISDVNSRIRESERELEEVHQKAQEAQSASRME